MARGTVEYPHGCGPVDPSSSSNVLIRLLKPVAEALHNSQSNEDVQEPNRFASLFEHLSDRAFLDNNCAEVAILLACSLADIFRVFAPNTPSGDHVRLREVLLFLIRNLKGLSQPNDPLFRRYFYLLENLYVVESLNLCLELPEDEPNVVIRAFIKTALETAKERTPLPVDGDPSAAIALNEQRDKVANNLIGIATKLLQAVPQVSNSVLDALFFFIVNPQKLNNKESYNMARAIIQTSQTSLEPSIQPFLTQALMTGALPDCELTGRIKLYEIVYELHEIAHELVYPNLPQIAERLNSVNEEDRAKATHLIGQLISADRSTLADDMPTVWEEFLKRFRDVVANIRIQCVKQAMNILLNQPQMRRELCGVLVERTRDSDESVRLAAVRSIVETAKKKLEAVPDDLINACAERIFDKKPRVRQDAARNLLSLHARVHADDHFTASDKASISRICTRILHFYRTSSPEDRLILEKLVVSSMIQYKLEAKKRMDVLVTVFEAIDSLAAKSFADIQTRGMAVRKTLRELSELIKVASVEEEEPTRKVEEAKRQVELRIARLAETHPDPTKAKEALKSWSNLLATDKMSMRLLDEMLSLTSPLETSKVESHVLEILRRAEGSLSSEHQEVVKNVVSRYAPLLIDPAAANALTLKVVELRRSADCFDRLARDNLTRVLHVWKVMAEHYPQCFTQAETIDLTIDMMESDDIRAVEAGFVVISAVAMVEDTRGQSRPWFSRALDVAIKAAKGDAGSQPGKGLRVAKLAVRLICRLKGRELALEPLREIIQAVNAHLSIDDPLCAVALTTLSTSVLCYPQDLVEELRDTFVNVVVKEIVLCDRVDTDVAEVDIRDADLVLGTLPKTPMMRSKLAGMKFLSRYLTALAEGVDEEAALCSKVINLFVEFIKNGGDVLRSPASENEKALLRANAGSNLLKVLYNHRYVNLLQAKQFVILGKLVHDEFHVVRSHFIAHLHKGLQRLRLNVEFVALYALAGLVRGVDKEEEKIFRTNVRNHVDSTFVRRWNILKDKQITPEQYPYKLPEYAVAYTVYLLAHQSVFKSSTDLTSIALLQECLWIVLEGYVNNKALADFPFIVNVFRDVLSYRDATTQEGKSESVEQNRKLYAMSEAGILMIWTRLKTQMKESVKKVILSKKFFVKVQKKISYSLPREIIDDEKGRNGRPPAEPKNYDVVKTNGKGNKEVTVNGTSDESSLGAASTRNTTRRPRTKRKKKSESEPSDIEDGEEDEADDDHIKPTTSTKQRVHKNLPKISLSPIKGSATRSRAGPPTSTPARPEDLVAKKDSPTKAILSPVKGSASRSRAEPPVSTPARPNDVALKKEPSSKRNLRSQPNGDLKNHSKLGTTEDEEGEEKEEAEPTSKRRRADTSKESATSSRSSRRTASSTKKEETPPQKPSTKSAADTPKKNSVKSSSRSTGAKSSQKKEEPPQPQRRSARTKKR